jgi:hypothetical protein
MIKKSIFGLLCVGVMCGCSTANRSISQYRYGYNPSYQGEMSEAEFVKDISAGGINGSAELVRIAKGEKVIVMQSGQIRPDAAMLGSLSGVCNVLPMSGIPAQHTLGNISLRDAAKAGGVSKIIAYWGNIETSTQPIGTQAISWVPVAGLFVPDTSQKMRVAVSAIIADTASGRWSDVTVVSKETEIIASSVNGCRKDSEQAELLKADAYQKLVQQLKAR